MSGWISCQEKLPHYGDDVLVWNGTIITIARLVMHDGERHWESDDDIAGMVPPTHWIAMPKPPTHRGNGIR